MAEKWHSTSVILTFQKKGEKGSLHQTVNHVSKDAKESDIKALGMALATLGDELIYVSATRVKKDTISE